MQGYDEQVVKDNGDGGGLLEAMLKGQLRHGFDLRFPLQDKKNERYFRHEPREQDKIHCVLLFQLLDQSDTAFGKLHKVQVFSYSPTLLPPLLPPPLCRWFLT